MRRLCRPRGERGALTPAVVVMALGLLLLGGLVTDGGRQLNAKLRAQATAEEAARAGANMLDFMGETSATVDEDKAAESAAEYCSQAMAQDDTITSCDVVGVGHDDNQEIDYVEVEVRIEEPALLFGIIGINTLDAQATARAGAVEGVTDPGEDVQDEQISSSVVYPSIPIEENTDDTIGLPEEEFELPSTYLTTLCGVETVLPYTVGQVCTTTEYATETTVTTKTKVPNPNPPPPSKNVKTTYPTQTTVPTTIYSPYPTTVTPPNW